MSNGFNWDKFLGKGPEGEGGNVPQPLAQGEQDAAAVPEGTGSQPLPGASSEDHGADGKPKSVFDLIPTRSTKGSESEPATPPPTRRNQEEEILIDPRNGMLIEDSPALEIPSALNHVEAPELELTVNKAEVEEPVEKSEPHYKPIYVDPSVHNIDVSDHRFENAQHANVPKVKSSDVLPLDNAHIDEVLRLAIERKASDIHFTVGLPPMARVDGEIVSLPYDVMDNETSRRMIYDTLTDEQLEKFENTHELDFAYTIRGLARFRFNVYMQRGAVTGALRVIPTKIPSFETLGLPVVIREIAKRSSGLVLVTGPTGSGKSTTIASMIDDINETRQSHILTIEDPIEYLHNHKRCMVNQRELHADTYSFHNALRAVLREDPDIILVGELRDLETIEAALTLAETGHLVFGTLHTRNAPSTIDRIIDVFPSDQQSQIRVLLGNTLEGVVSQQLLPKLGGGRVAALEIMLGTPAIKNLIREGKTHQMYSSIETGAQMGMQTMDSSLATHFRNGYTSYEECLMRAVDKESFARLAKMAA